jgi:8-amino-7-oxononanoate synthase
VVEGLYSISGDVAPLREIAAACREASVMLMVDEAHSFGAYGARGLGCAEADEALDSVDFIVGTFSKALAGIGGFCVSNHEALRYLHFTARPYVFTASGSPASIAGVEAALRVLAREPGLRDRLWRNVRRVHRGLRQAGFTLKAAESPVVSIEVGAAPAAVAFWRALVEAGVYTNLVLPPACRPDACLLRTSYSAAHTSEQIDRALDTFIRVGQSLSLVGSPTLP